METRRGTIKKRWLSGGGLMLAFLLVLAAAIFAGLPAAAAGPQEIEVTESDTGGSVDVNGQVLVLKLHSNPSTGYGWQVRGLDQAILLQLDDGEWLPDTPGLLGGPGTQVLRFAAVATGKATLDLVYARPWEMTTPPDKAFSLEVSVAEPSRNVSYPRVNIRDQAATDSGASLSALPTAYNWCALGGCTPVRNQLSCGSCWAFGTVGPLESAILIKDGLSKDLSEQFLVSCNTDGWSCSGGWWAHNYHEAKLGKLQTAAGAVYELDFPYTATNGSCDKAYNHYERIADWVYIATQYSVPTTAAIKQAIYDYGPVSAAVCVNTAFQNYTGGVFNPATSCSDINHAIVLVGWDDSVGAWILRNSWGPNWGENGYMRIAYGKNYVGYSANYVVYNAAGPTPTPAPATPTATPTPVTPTPTPAIPAAPSGLTATASTTSRSITLAWLDNSTNETGFKIERCRGAICTNFAQIATVGANIKTYTDASLASRTTYRYRVRAYNAAGNSAYSNIASATTLR